MTYTKPCVVIVRNALEAIQGNDKCFFLFIDSVPPHNRTMTIAAYEADE